MDPQQRAERRDKDLAALARRGFSLSIACQVLDAEDPDQAEALIE
jgi:regulatory protein